MEAFSLTWTGCQHLCQLRQHLLVVLLMPNVQLLLIQGPVELTAFQTHIHAVRCTGACFLLYFNILLLPVAAML